MSNTPSPTLTERPRRRQMFLATALIAALITPLVAQEEGEEVLASARGVFITALDWQDEVAGNRRLSRSRLETHEAAEDLIKTRMAVLLSRRLDLQEAEETGLLDTAPVQAHLARREREMLGRWVGRVLLAEVEISSAEVAARHEARQASDPPDNISFYHLFLDLADLSEEAAATKRVLAEEIVAQARATPDVFADLMAEHSDSEVRGAGDIIGPMSPSQLIPELREPLWQLGEGEISDPLESRFGIHIFQVQHRVSQIRSFEQARSSLEREMRNEQMDAQIEELVADAEAELDLTLHATPESLVADTPIVSGAEEISGAQFAAALEWEEGAWPEGEALAAQITDFQRQVVLAHLAQRRGSEDDEALVARIAQQREEAIGNLVWERRLDEAQLIDDAAVRAHWEENPEQSTEPRRVRGRTLELRPGRRAAPGEEFAHREILDQAQAIRAQVEEGADFEALVREHSTADDAAEGGEVRWIYPHGRDSGLMQSLANLATGEVSEPLRLGDGYLLVQVLAVEENVASPLEDAAEGIRQQLQRERNRRVWGEHLDALREEIEWSLPEEVIAPFVLTAVTVDAPPAPEE